MFEYKIYKNDLKIFSVISWTGKFLWNALAIRSDVWRFRRRVALARSWLNDSSTRSRRRQRLVRDRHGLSHHERQPVPQHRHPRRHVWRLARHDRAKGSETERLRNNHHWIRANVAKGKRSGCSLNGSCSTCCQRWARSRQLPLQVETHQGFDAAAMADPKTTLLRSFNSKFCWQHWRFWNLVWVSRWV